MRRLEHLCRLSLRRFLTGRPRFRISQENHKHASRRGSESDADRQPIAADCSLLNRRHFTGKSFQKSAIPALLIILRLAEVTRRFIIRLLPIKQVQMVLPPFATSRLRS